MHIPSSESRKMTNTTTHFSLSMRRSSTKSCRSGLMNAPPAFNDYINPWVWWYIDDFAECYLGVIPIYSTNDKEHEEPVWKVLTWVQELCKGNNADIRPTKQSGEFRDVETGNKGSDSACRTCIPDVKLSLHWCTHPDAFRSSWADYSSNWCQWFHELPHSQPVQWFRDSPTSYMLLSTMLKCRTDLHHVQSGALGHCGYYKVMASLPQRSKSSGPHTM